MNIFVTQSKYNEILMGYFIKIINNLYKCQKLKVFYYLLSNRQLIRYINLDKYFIKI